MNPYRSAGPTPKIIDWKGIFMRATTFSWGLALGSGGLFVGLLIGSGGVAPEAKMVTEMIALFGLVGGLIGFVANGGAS